MLLEIPENIFEEVWGRNSKFHFWPILHIKVNDLQFLTRILKIIIINKSARRGGAPQASY